MIICPNCGRENADHYKFCLGCGTEIAGGAPSGGPKPVAGAGVSKLGRPAGGRLKLKSPLFAKERPAGLGGGLGGLGGLSSRLKGKSEPAEDEVDEPEDEAPEDDASESAAPESAAPDRPSGPRPVAGPGRAAPPVKAREADEIEIPTDDFDDEDDFGEGAFEGEIAPPDDDEDFGALDADDVFDADASTEVAPDEVDDDDVFDPGPAQPARPAAARPVAPARAVGVPRASADPGPAKAPARPAPVQPARPVGPPPMASKPVAAPVAFDEPDEPDDLDDSVLEDAPPAGRVCHACGAIVPDGFKFCGVCGSRYDAPQPAEEPSAGRAPSGPMVAAPTAHLVLIHPDGTEGEIFPLNAGETTVGRSHPSPIFSEDPFLSPRHATFYFVQGQLYVRDESSLNGVFLRIRAEVELFHWDMFRIGQQLLRFEDMSQVRPIMPGSGDGTTVMGSPVRGTWGRLASVVALDTTTAVWPLRKPEVFLGRERGEIVFPDDGFVSGSHCKLAMRRGRFFLGDLDSTNGTYLRIKGEGIVTRGDLLLLGQQLFKVQLNR